MLTHLFSTCGSNILFISFAPVKSEGKYLFGKFSTLKVADTLLFNDTADNFYLDDQENLINIINDYCSSYNYTRIIITGFSAGSFIACSIASKISFNGGISIYAFSPQVHLGAPHSTSWTALKDRYDLSNYTLKSVVDASPDKHQYYLFFSTDALRDGIHLCDSFALNRTNVKLYFLNCNHDTTAVVRDNYPYSLLGFIDDTVIIPPQYLADQEQILKCIMLTDIGISELNEKLSQYSGPYLLPRNYGSEFCYWHSRQLSRMGHIQDAMWWGWAAIAKSSLPIPDSYPETLGNIAFDNGFIDDALKAYKMLSNPSLEVIDRINRFTIEH